MILVISSAGDLRGLEKCVKETDANRAHVRPSAKMDRGRDPTPLTLPPVAPLLAVVLLG